MRQAGIVPVQELETNFISHPPRPLFPNVQEDHFRSVGPPVEGDKLLALFPPIGDATYQFYKFYQIKNGQTQGVNVNMPLVIIDTLGAGIIQEASGFDIRVFDSSGSPLDYEVAEVTPGTGDFIVFVNVATVADGEFVQLTFGKPTATDGSNPNAVYDVNYKGAYHLSEPTGATIIDSSSNNNDGTPSVGLEPVSVDAKIGKGLDFSTLDAMATLPNSLGEDYTISIWGKIPASDDRTGVNAFNGNQILNADVGGNADDYIPMAVINNHMSTFIGESGGTNFTLEGDIIVNTDVFIAITITRLRGTLGELQIYINGELDKSLSVNNLKTLTDSASIFFGVMNVGVGRDTGGTYDELRFSDIVRTADWIKTEFNNQNDNDAFWFTTPLLTNGEDNFLVDDQGRFIVAEGQ